VPLKTNLQEELHISYLATTPAGYNGGQQRAVGAGFLRSPFPVPGFDSLALYKNPTVAGITAMVLVERHVTIRD